MSQTTVIGVLGGVGSGKSSITRMLQGHGALALDADAVAHESLNDPAVVKEIVERFGSGVIDARGRIDREALGRLVFHDESTNEREALNAIVHPRVRERLDAELSAARREGIRFVVLDVPLLLESKYKSECDCLVFVRSKFATRLERVRSRGWDEEELRRREAAQTPLVEKERLADFVVDNDGPIEAMHKKVGRWLDELTGEGQLGDRNGESR